MPRKTRPEKPNKRGARGRSPLREIRTYTRFVGGFAGNVSTGLARLGVRTAIVSRVGDDGHGEFVQSFLAAEGIYVRFLAVDPEWLTPPTFCEIWPPDDFPITFYRRPTVPERPSPCIGVHVTVHQADRNPEEIAGLQIDCFLPVRTVLQTKATGEQDAEQASSSVVMPIRSRSARNSRSGHQEDPLLERLFSRDPARRASRLQLVSTDDLDAGHVDLPNAGGISI